MQVPLEVAFHNIKSAKWAKDLIRARVAELEEIYGRLPAGFASTSARRTAPARFRP
jgi:hypothetical protein